MHNTAYSIGMPSYTTNSGVLRSISYHSPRTCPKRDMSQKENVQKFNFGSTSFHDTVDISYPAKRRSLIPSPTQEFKENRHVMIRCHPFPRSKKYPVCNKSFGDSKVAIFLPGMGSRSTAQVLVTFNLHTCTDGEGGRCSHTRCTQHDARLDCGSLHA